MLKFIENSELLSRLSADADGSFVSSKLDEIEQDTVRLKHLLADFSDLQQDRAEIEDLIKLNRATAKILESLSALLRQKAVPRGA